MTQKTAMDVELLLRWAYVEELSKRQLSAAEGIWDKIQDFTNHGGIDSGRGAAQRYSHFGLPDSDAELIEQAVSALGETVIDWPKHFDEIAGDMAGLITINDVMPVTRKSRAPAVGWGKSGTKALKAFFGEKGAAPHVDKPRDVLLVGGIKTDALITMHAVKGSRPDWDVVPEIEMTPAKNGANAFVVGERLGKNRYTIGSYCPLVWSPSPLSIVMSRADYFAWRAGLQRLAETLTLEKFTPLTPSAPSHPWIDNDEWVSRVIPVKYGYVGPIRTLPLKPDRPRAGRPYHRKTNKKDDLDTCV